MARASWSPGSVHTADGSQKRRIRQRTGQIRPGGHFRQVRRGQGQAMHQEGRSTDLYLTLSLIIIFYPVICYLNFIGNTFEILFEWRHD